MLQTSLKMTRIIPYFPNYSKIGGIIDLIFPGQARVKTSFTVTVGSSELSTPQHRSSYFWAISSQIFRRPKPELRLCHISRLA